jgi:endonuclease/exonuclease/phosphatase family metal-dependent hydrolase
MSGPRHPEACAAGRPAPDATPGRTSASIVSVETDEATGPLHVATFNLRCAQGETPPHTWPERRPLVAALLRRERPHLLGTQEGLDGQLRDLEADLAGYESLGVGREGGRRGEAMQVFYDPRRLAAEAHGHYWLSDTPDVVGSKTWGGCCPRMVTWVRFADTVSGARFVHVNTHLEAFSADARARSATLLLARTRRHDPSLPVLLTGDLNEPARPGEAVYDTLVTHGPFVDTWEAAHTRGPAAGTFHGYAPPDPEGPRLDWVLATPGVRTVSSHLVTDAPGGRFPSDHLPVHAVLRLPTPAGG